MPDIERLKCEMNNSGMTFTSIAQKSGILRETLYNRLNRKGEFTASEIMGLTKALRFSKQVRDEIFLNEKLNEKKHDGSTK